MQQYVTLHANKPNLIEKELLFNIHPHENLDIYIFVRIPTFDISRFICCHNENNLGQFFETFFLLQLAKEVLVKVNGSIRYPLSIINCYFLI